MLHTVIRASIESASMALPRYSMTWPAPPPVPIFGDDREHDVLRGDPRLQLAVDDDGHGAERLERQGLGGQDVLDLGRADTERQSAERAVGRRVAVAADDGQAGLG
jgi:hypothetical protein